MRKLSDMVREAGEAYGLRRVRTVPGYRFFGGTMPPGEAIGAIISNAGLLMPKERPTADDSLRFGLEDIARGLKL